jgi:hypothetical protein
MSSKVQINELRLRVPWSQRHQAKRLGEAVAESLADQVSDLGQPRTIASLNTTVHAGSNATTDQMANEIARSIRSHL